MDVHEEAVLEWLQGERSPILRALMVQEITFQAHKCKLWPAGSSDVWDAAIGRCIKAGLVTESEGDKIKIAPPKKESKEEQLELF